MSLHGGDGSLTTGYPTSQPMCTMTVFQVMEGRQMACLQAILRHIAASICNELERQASPSLQSLCKMKGR